jgi:hypothetical protein
MGTKKLQPKSTNGSLGLALSLNLTYQLHKLNQTIYVYQETNYPKIAQVLAAEKATKIMATAGINLQFFLPQTIDFQVVLFPEDIKKLKAQGFDYLLIDNYYQVVGATVFEKTASQPYKNTLFTGTENTLLSPLLHLEHCEFTGYTFWQALQNQKAMQKRTNHLRLIKL